MSERTVPEPEPVPGIGMRRVDLVFCLLLALRFRVKVVYAMLTALLERTIQNTADLDHGQSFRSTDIHRVGKVQFLLLESST